VSAPRIPIVAAAMAAALALGTLWAARLVPGWSESALVHPPRRPPPPPPAIPHDDVELEGEGVHLRGWRFPATGARRGLVVYLHGFGDDRREGEGIARRFGPLGLEVLAYDSRAHGESGGEACTYGVLEKRDLERVLDQEMPRSPVALPVVLPVALIGGSLGAAVALQAAAEDPRISLVVAIAPYADLETIAVERAPSFVSRAQVAEALALAGREGGFAVADASPLAAAPRIRCPVLLVHGDADLATPPEHSRRILAALAGPRELLIVPGVGHYDPAGPAAWERIDRAVSGMLGGP
jgi:pimeloyl-ACP methyl ester carboxylesterase